MKKKILDQSTINKIRYLRSVGNSFPEIKNKLGISFRKVYEFGKGTTIRKVFLKKWKERWGGSHKRMFFRTRKIEETVRKKFGRPTNRDLAFSAAALYWAEGEKVDFGLSNSDPWMIALTIFCLEKIFSIDKTRIKISIRVYEDMNIRKCKEFWSKVTGIPETDFKAIHILKGRKNGKLKYGMCRIRVTRPGDLIKEMRSMRGLLLAPIAQFG